MDIHDAFNLLTDTAGELVPDDVLKKGIHELGKIVGNDVEASLERASILVTVVAMVMYARLKDDESLPLQPVIFDGAGRARFKKNTIVEDLLSEGKINMHELARRGDRYTEEERAQFATLIGYSVDGFAELPYVSGDDIDAADMIVTLKRSGDTLPDGLEIEEDDE